MKKALFIPLQKISGENYKFEEAEEDIYAYKNQFSVHVFKNSESKNKKKCISHANLNILDERIKEDKITAYVL